MYVLLKYRDLITVDSIEIEIDFQANNFSYHDSDKDVKNNEK